MISNRLDEEAIFKAACRIESPQARADYLRKACGDDQALYDRVSTLLQVHDEEPSFLESPAAGIVTNIDLPPVQDLAGTQIGLYKLREQIGEGGFGVVYVAEQDRPVSRKVALKIIKPGMDTKDVIARFEAERQALALINHPNVATVLDAGATESGRPYFVMELVKGVPITDFCDDQKLSTHQRLTLFLDVCRAIQHAHQKGIIHRDLKPSNVMVTMHGDRPVVKVIDFGVAKALSSKLTEKTVYTAYGQLVGTPMYMSPEQAQLSGLDVDTRSDVYSLGVLLYELLTGATPFDKETLTQAGFDEMRRIIRKDEPPRPSIRVSTLNAEALSTISDQRRIDPRKLGQSLRGELDWIVMKALEKDPNRRYESASAFAADIERLLKDESVEACPPSAGYRLRKLARRNRVAIVTTTLVVTSLTVGTVISLWQALRAAEAERVAEQRFHDESRARARAEREQDLAALRRQISHASFEAIYATSDFSTINFSIDEDATTRLVNSRDNVELHKDEYNRHFRRIRELQELAKQFSNDPDVKYDLAASHATLGISLARLGKTDLAIEELKRSVSLTDEAQRLGSSARSQGLFSQSRILLGRLLRFAGRTNEALKYSHLLGIAFGPRGHLFVSSRTLNSVLRFDGRTGAFLGEFCRGHGLASPHGLTFGDDGYLYVSSEAGNCILRFDGSTGVFKDVFASNVIHPVGLVFGLDGDLYVSCHGSRQISRYDGTDGTLKKVFVRPGSGGLARPSGLAFGPAGNLYVASQWGNDAVLLYNGETGEFIKEFARKKGLVPSYLSFGPDNNLYVTSLTAEVFCFDGRAGSLIYKFSNGGSGSYHGLAFGPDGRLYVAEDTGSSVWRFDFARGELVDSFTSLETVELKRGADENTSLKNTETQ